MNARPIVSMLGLLCAACSSSPSEPSSAAPSPASVAAEPAAPTAAEPAASAAAEPAAPTAAEPAAPADPNEACGQILLVAYRGAAHADASQKRTKAEAQQRAQQLLALIREAGDFGGTARAESDAKQSALRGGVIGTFKKDDWPPLHAALRDPLFALEVGEIASEPVEAPYGYVLLRRCPVEKVHTRHILVRYAGAEHAGPEIERTKAEAKARAGELLAKLEAGADFAQLAKEASDDSSAERGGDLGVRARGALALPYEKAAFALKPGQRSGIVESEFGFHIIQRLPD